jgi:hypothetical protein
MYRGSKHQSVFDVVDDMIVRRSAMIKLFPLETRHAMYRITIESVLMRLLNENKDSVSELMEYLHTVEAFEAKMFSLMNANGNYKMLEDLQVLFKNPNELNNKKIESFLHHHFSEHFKVNQQRKKQNKKIRTENENY